MIIDRNCSETAKKRDQFFQFSLENKKAKLIFNNCIQIKEQFDRWPIKNHLKGVGHCLFTDRSSASLSGRKDAGERARKVAGSKGGLLGAVF